MYVIKEIPLTGRAKSDGRGKYQKKVITEVMCNSARNHIRSFPIVVSHYCRSETTRQFLEASLKVIKMYDFYVQMCSEQEMEPVKQSYYQFIFKKEFNLAFYQPKKDRCDKC